MKVFRLATAILLLSTVECRAVELTGKAEIIDGDTLVVQGVTVRLFGIDIAETGQPCVNQLRKMV